MQFKTRRMPKHEFHEEELSRIDSLTRPQLEVETARELLKHRKFVESDELIYQEWRKAELESMLPKQIIERMREDCVRRRYRTLSHQELLSRMIERLGYIPQMSGDQWHTEDENQIRR